MLKQVQHDVQLVGQMLKQVQHDVQLLGQMLEHVQHDGPLIEIPPLQQAFRSAMWVANSALSQPCPSIEILLLNYQLHPRQMLKQVQHDGLLIEIPTLNDRC